MGVVRGSRWLRRMGQGFIILLGGMAALFLLMQFLVARQQTPSFEQVRSAYRSSYVNILDRNGQRLQQLRLDFQERRGEWTALEAASPALQDALLASEDRRFYNHHGVDGLALLGALAKRLSSGYSGGASTITMQLVGMLDEQLHRQKRSRSYRQKIKQIIMAQALERHWS
ncbi:MAG: transglycosylase domain-containing protein, partial [Alcaligenaceae bacterium]|nr:transglycosylase domain-containing protein [Alcaligenaceae bacterium]